MTDRTFRPTKLLPFEFRVFRRIGESLRGKRVLVACSGGRDSVALAACLVRLAPRAGFEVALAHVHHGFTGDEALRLYRNQARAHVKRLANDLGVPVFVSSVSRASGEHRSEEALRDLRLDRLAKVAKKQRFDVIAFAHHADDLLETRLIRLVRGTGPEGLEAMKERSEGVIRPFLRESVRDVAAYVAQKKIEWIDDPSNASVEPLRNWMRLEWIPALEAKRPGSAVALARSLEMVASYCSRTLEEANSVSNSQAGSVSARLERSRFESSKNFERLGTLARYVRSLGVRNSTQARLAEIDKRILAARGRKAVHFRVLGLEWSLSPEWITACCAIDEKKSSLRRTPKS